jgi:hypothetical protein
MEQAHHRNISSVSDISVTIDPIKREDGDEIKVDQMWPLNWP